MENKIELHYWLKDNSHIMNAFVLNKCEWELLHLLKEVATIENVDLKIEAEAISEGGIIQWLHIKYESLKNSSIGPIAFGALITLFLTDIPKMCIEELFEFLDKNTEMEQLLIEEKKIEIEGKKLDNDIKRMELNKLKIENAQILKDTLDRISSDTKVQKRVSNFYEELLKEEKVDSIVINNYEYETNTLNSTVEIKREDFTKYILVSNELEPIIDENAIIEIISPVLKKGKYYWRGIYNGEVLNFKMGSNEFKTKVQLGEIEFKNGTNIKCVLEKKRRINNNGEEIISSYNIIKVLEIYNQTVVTETDEGRLYRRKKEVEDSQLDFSFE